MRIKIISILVCTILFFLILDYAVHRLVVLGSYLTLEKNEVEKDISRCFGALQREIDHIDTVANDWGAWDDTYRFVQDGNEEYIESNLGFETFSSNQLNLIYICDARRNVVWGEVRTPETYDIIELEELAPDNIMEIQGLFQPDAPHEFVSGVWMTSRYPFLISSRPILNSDDTGPPLGHFIMGRILTEEYVKNISRQTRVLHSYDPIRNGVPDSFPEDIPGRITPDNPFVFSPVDGGLMRAYAVFPDLLGVPALLLQADIERFAIGQGRRALWSVLISVSIMGALLLAVIILFLNRAVIRPLSDLTTQVVKFEKLQRFSSDSLSGRRDEIGQLYREFSRMVSKLQQAYQEDRETNLRLEQEIHGHRVTERELQSNQERLRALSSDLVMIEDRERRHLAMELHDRIGQALAVLRIQIELLLKHCDPRSENVERIRGLIESVIQDSRSLIFEISPPVLYELGLGPAVEWLAEEMMERHDIVIEVRDHLETPLEDGVRGLIFRSVRELLYNIVKHSGADHAWVRLKQKENNLQIVVEDNGVGFNPGEKIDSGPHKTGFGLFSIQERVRQLGGKLEITPRRPGGTVAALAFTFSLSMGVLTEPEKDIS